MTCIDRASLITDHKNYVRTQYREADKLLAIIDHDLNQIADVADAICTIPEKHDILTAVGDQLTNVGKRLGWPRCHCICSEPGPVFAWDCTPPKPTRTYTNFCDPEGTWDGCEDVGASDYCFNDDEVYRGYLLARRFQALQLYEIDSMQAAAKHIWGETASAYSMGGGRAAVAPGRALTATETREIPLAFRVLPFAPGIRTFIDNATAPLWGFGGGWADVCTGVWSCPEEIDPYNC